MDVLFSRALQHFCQAYDDGNLRIAAERLGVTQPAITKSIRKLEEHTGAPLFLRKPDGMRPTRFADILRRHGQNILNESRIVSMEIAAMREVGTGVLRIGFGMALVGTPMSRVLSACRRRFPNLAIEASTGVAEHMIPLLSSGEFDVWLGVLSGIEKVTDVASEQAGSISMHAFARADHPLAQSESISTARLSDFDWACFHHDVEGIAELDKSLIAAGGSHPRIALKLSSVTTSLMTALDSDLLLYGSEFLEEDARRYGLVKLRSDQNLHTYPYGIAYRTEAKDLTVTRFLTSQSKTLLEGAKSFGPALR